MRGHVVQVHHGDDGSLSVCCLITYSRLMQMVETFTTSRDIDALPK